MFDELLCGIDGPINLLTNLHLGACIDLCALAVNFADRFDLGLAPEP